MSKIQAIEISSEEYVTFLSSVSHSGFQNLEILKLTADSYALQIILLGFFDNKKIIAVTPLLRRKIGPFSLWGAPLRKTIIPPAVPFCAPTKNAEAILPALQDWIKKKKIDYLQITYPNDSPLPPNNSKKIEPQFNLEVDLSSSFEEFWASIPGKKRYRLRRQLRKALKSNVKVHYYEKSDILSAYFGMLKDTYNRQFGGIHPNFPKKIYQKILTNKDKLNMHIYTATCQNVPISAIWLLEDNERCYYWDAASSNLGRQLNANHLLAWSLINRSRRLGHKCFDFVGGGKGRLPGSRPGIGRFKRLMGASPKPYQILFWYSPVMRVALYAYRMLNKIINLHYKKQANELLPR